MNKKILLIIFLALLIIPLITFANGDVKTTPVSLSDPLGDSHPKPAELIGRIIHAALGIVGSIALAMFIYGGFVWMTAAGNSEKVQKGKDVLIWATLGLVIIFSAYALVNFVIKKAILGTT